MSGRERSRGLAELAASALLFGLMAYLTKHATRRLGGAQAATIRFAIGVLVIAALVAAGRVRLRPRRYGFLIARGLLGGLAVLGYFLAIAHIPVGTATLLHFTAPVWTASFAALFLGERLPAAMLGALASAGGGVALVVYGQGRALGGSYAWQLIALGAALVSGAAVTTIRAARRFDGAWEVLAAFCLVGALATAPFAIPGWRDPTGREWLLLGAVGLVAVAAQLLMTHALGVIEAATAGILSQLTVVTAMGLGHLVDGEPLTGLSALGALLTLGGVTLAARISAREKLEP